jgi:hypothetical protein
MSVEVQFGFGTTVRNVSEEEMCSLSKTPYLGQAFFRLELDMDIFVTKGQKPVPDVMSAKLELPSRRSFKRATKYRRGLIG